MKRTLTLVICSLFALSALGSPALAGPKKKKKSSKAVGKFIKTDEVKGFFKKKSKAKSKRALKKASGLMGAKGKKRLKKADKVFGKYIDKKAVKRSSKKSIKKRRKKVNSDLKKRFRKKKKKKRKKRKKR